MNPLLTASNEFGFSTPAMTSSNSNGGAVSQTEPGTTLSSVEATASGVWYRHPTVGIAVIVGVTALLLERANRPLAHVGAHGSAGLGPVSGSAGGEFDV